VDVVTQCFAVGFEFVDHLLRRAEDGLVSQFRFALSVKLVDGLAGENLLVVLLDVEVAVAHLLPGVLAGVLGVDVIDSNGAIAHQEVNNRSPIKYGAAVTVRYRVTDPGDTSLSMASKMAADDVLAAEGTVVHVVLDESDAPAAVPELWVEQIRAFEDDVDSN